MLDVRVLLPPATKLGQSYIFTGVCNSVHSGGCLVLGGCLVPGGACPEGVPGPGDLVPGGCLVPRGFLVWGVPGPGGYLVPGGCLVLGGCLVPRGGVWWRAPSPGRLLLRAVRILLECILVTYSNCYKALWDPWQSKPKSDRSFSSDKPWKSGNR